MSDWIERENPAHPDEIVGRVPLSTPADVDRAVRAADVAQQGWAALTLDAAHRRDPRRAGRAPRAQRPARRR